MNILPYDILGIITTYIKNASVWKAWQLTCQATLDCCNNNYQIEYKLTDHLATATLAYPDYDWNYRWLSKRIKRALCTPRKVKCNSFVTNKIWNLLLSDPAKDLDYNQLSKNRSLTWDIVAANLTRPWCYHRLSKFMPWEAVIANPDKSWDYYILSKNPNITYDIVAANPTLPNGSTWSYYHLSANPGITWDIIRQHPDAPWNYFQLIYCGKIPWHWITVYIY
jgi:hypothetical protein